MSSKRPELPRISIITPSYNQGRFLDQCLRSVVEQGYPNLEYLVIDGGSTDESVQVIQQHQQHLTYWVTEPDGGQSDAINKGFQRATGDIVAWLNSDDFYLPGALRAVAEAYGRQPEASFYFGDGWRVDETGQPLSRFFRAGHVAFKRLSLVYGLNTILQPAAFINRQHVGHGNLLEPQLKYGMDSDLWLRLARAAAPEPIAECLAASREYGVTKTSTGMFPRAEELRQIAEKHSGLPLTPGALLYYLDTLQRLAEQHPDIYPQAFLSEMHRFWRAASERLAVFGAGPDGFPVDEDSQPTVSKPKLLARFRERIARLLPGAGRQQQSEACP